MILHSIPFYDGETRPSIFGPREGTVLPGISSCPCITWDSRPDPEP